MAVRFAPTSPMTVRLRCGATTVIATPMSRDVRTWCWRGLALPERALPGRTGAGICGGAQCWSPCRHSPQRGSTTPSRTYASRSTCFTVCRCVYLRCVHWALSAYWRSSAMDELAHLADADPLVSRTSLDDTRMVAVLSAAAAAIDWTGRHQGHGPIDGATLAAGSGPRNTKTRRRAAPWLQR